MHYLDSSEISLIPTSDLHLHYAEIQKTTQDQITEEFLHYRASIQEEIARRKNLSVEYTPITFDSLNIWDKIWPILITTKQDSHDKTMSMLNQYNLTKENDIQNPDLMPSEIRWCAKVLATKFGKLNEMLLARSIRDIYKTEKPWTPIRAELEVIGKIQHDGRPMIVTKTISKNQNWEELLQSIDYVVLLHDVHKQIYEEQDRTSNMSWEIVYETIREVYFRHERNEEKWRNNIHTRDYARKFGFKEEIPEYIIYMDRSFSALYKLLWEDAYNFSIRVKKLLPMYKWDKIKVKLKATEWWYKIMFLKKSDSYDDQYNYIRFEADLVRNKKWYKDKDDIFG